MSIETKIPLSKFIDFIDPRITYPKWTRNSKKKRISFEKYFKICMLESGKLMYERIVRG